jgi:hypothetical protein
MRTGVAQYTTSVDSAAPRQLADAVRLAVGAQQLRVDLLIFLKRMRDQLPRMCGIAGRSAEILRADT